MMAPEIQNGGKEGAGQCGSGNWRRGELGDEQTLWKRKTISEVHKRSFVKLKAPGCGSVDFYISLLLS